MVSKFKRSNKKTGGIAVVVPAFNEEKGIKKCVSAVIKTIKEIDLRMCLIVVNDGSKDKTSKILKSLKKQYRKNLFILDHKINKGYGAAVKTGGIKAFKLNFKYIVVFDSDLTNDTSHIKEFAKHYSENHDLIKGSRFIKGGSMRDVPFRRKIVSLTGNIVAGFLFGMGLRDCTNGLRMLKTSFIKNIPYKERGFASILEELYYLKKLKASSSEIPNILSSRLNTKSSFHYTPKLLLTYFKYAFKAFLINV